MLAFAAQLDRLSLLLAVFAAVLSVGSTGCDRALTCGVRAFFLVRHGCPPRCDFTARWRASQANDGGVRLEPATSCVASVRPARVHRRTRRRVVSDHAASGGAS